MGNYLYGFMGNLKLQQLIYIVIIQNIKNTLKQITERKKEKEKERAM